MNKTLKILLIVIGSIFILFVILAVLGGDDPDGVTEDQQAGINWDNIRVNDVAYTGDEWGEPKILSISNDGWEEGVYIDWDGKTIYYLYTNFDAFRWTFYKPGDIVLTGPNLDSEKSCTHWLYPSVEKHSCGTILDFVQPPVPRLDFFYSEKTTSGWSNPTPHPLTLAHSIGGLTLTNNGNRAYFSMPFTTDGAPDLAYADKVNGKWGEPIKIPVVSSEYEEGDPYVNTEDNEMFFLSRRPSNMQGDNIYRSVKVNGEWQTPELMPEPVNSNGNDMQTFLFEDYLYFSSDRGVSGAPIAIYKSKRVENNEWGEPELVIKGNFGVGELSLPSDGSRLYFEQIFTDGEGHFNADMMYVERK
tara:strand:- start:137 stop:1213 length:1077 start_codon:yes stop_codon:yes gene_type:complete